MDSIGELDDGRRRHDVASHRRTDNAFIKTC